MENATATELLTIARLLRDGGSTAALVFVVVGGMRGWFVWGSLYERTLRERDQWQEIALASLKVAHNVTKTPAP